MPEASVSAIKRLGAVWQDLFARVNEREVLAIRLSLVELIRLVADRIASPTLHTMAVIVEYFLERAEIDDCLVALEAWTLFAFECPHGHGTELDALNSAPRFFVALENLNAIKAAVAERLQKSFFGKRAADATAPKLRVVLQVLRHWLVGNNVRDDRAAALPEHAVNLIEQLPLRARL